MKGSFVWRRSVDNTTSVLITFQWRSKTQKINQGLKATRVFREFQGQLGIQAQKETVVQKGNLAHKGHEACKGPRGQRGRPGHQGVKAQTVQKVQLVGGVGRVHKESQETREIKVIVVTRVSLAIRVRRAQEEPRGSRVFLAFVVRKAGRGQEDHKETEAKLALKVFVVLMAHVVRLACKVSVESVEYKGRVGSQGNPGLRVCVASMGILVHQAPKDHQEAMDHKGLGDEMDFVDLRGHLPQTSL